MILHLVDLDRNCFRIHHTTSSFIKWKTAYSDSLNWLHTNLRTCKHMIIFFNFFKWRGNDRLKREFAKSDDDM